jgi:type IV pilus modification protein PilV
MRERDGFTLVEVLIAVLVLSIGLLGLVSSAALTTRMIGQGQRFTEASTMAGQQFEVLRSQTCAAMAGGTRAEGRFAVAWTIDSAVAGGRAQAVTVIVQSPTTYGMRADSFATVMPC